MSDLGMGVMIQMLFSDNKETVDTLNAAIGKVIKDLKLSGEDNSLHFTLKNGFKFRIFDNGQSCCEDRYMRTDDDLKEHIGGKLLRVALKDAPPVEEGGNVHEVQFLEIETTKGIFTMSNHNQHNGYYGGFYVVATPER